MPLSWTSMLVSTTSRRTAPSLPFGGIRSTATSVSASKCQGPNRRVVIPLPPAMPRQQPLSNPRSRLPPRCLPKRKRPTIPRRQRLSPPWRRLKRPSPRSLRMPRPSWRRRCSMLPPPPRKMPKPRPRPSMRPSTTIKASQPESSRSTKKRLNQTSHHLLVLPPWGPRSHQRYPMADESSLLLMTLLKSRRRLLPVSMATRCLKEQWHPVAYWKGRWLRKYRPSQPRRHLPFQFRRSPLSHRVNAPSLQRNRQHR
mmetsp:Transcript_15308/g.44279  ORF Transcript_15308/g.44279 Transcript_15308/m.44279 type:complete len:255 (+) Transcript_15308:1687-2451(+)